MIWCTFTKVFLTCGVALFYEDRVPLVLGYAALSCVSQVVMGRAIADAATSDNKTWVQMYT